MKKLFEKHRRSPIRAYDLESLDFAFAELRKAKDELSKVDTSRPKPIKSFALEQFIYFTERNIVRYILTKRCVLFEGKKALILKNGIIFKRKPYFYVTRDQRQTTSNQPRDKHD